MNLSAMTDTAIQSMLGERIKVERLNQNRTQMEIARAAGVGIKLVERLENGSGCHLRNLIKILRALGKIDQVDSLLPEPGISPLVLARLAGRQRKGASGGRGRPPRKKE